MPRDTHTVPNSISAGVKYGRNLKKTDSGDSLEASSGSKSWLGRIYGTGQALGQQTPRLLQREPVWTQDMELPSLPKALHRGLWWMEDPYRSIDRSQDCVHSQPEAGSGQQQYWHLSLSVRTSLFP